MSASVPTRDELAEKYLAQLPYAPYPDTGRGIVWEPALGMRPAHVRLLLLSATVGNAAEFLAWLQRAHGRKIDLVEGKERKVPLTFRWVGDEFLGDQLVRMAKGEA